MIRELTATEVADLDPGIREIVVRLRAAGFDTTDSGDGASKTAIGDLDLAMGCAMPVPNVMAVTNEATMIAEALRMLELLGDGWVVQATWATDDQRAVLIATKDAESRR